MGTQTFSPNKRWHTPLLASFSLTSWVSSTVSSSQHENSWHCSGASGGTGALAGLGTRVPLSSG